jgi:hypothetical protein
VDAVAQPEERDPQLPRPARPAKVHNSQAARGTERMPSGAASVQGRRGCWDKDKLNRLQAGKCTSPFWRPLNSQCPCPSLRVVYAVKFTDAKRQSRKQAAGLCFYFHFYFKHHPPLALSNLPAACALRLRAAFAIAIASASILIPGSLSLSLFLFSFPPCQLQWAWSPWYP